MSGLEGTLNNSITHWNSLPSEIFLSLYKHGRWEVILIKFRETTGLRTLFNETEPWRGVKFIDAMGTNDYFLGEFVIVDKRLWNSRVSLQAIVLRPKKSQSKKSIEKIRDDGFIKTYLTTNRSLVISKV